MTVLAHAGHWLINLLYAAPVIALVVLLVVDRIRNRNAAGDELPGDADGSPERHPE